MTDSLNNIIDQALAADLTPFRDFLFANPSEPLICTGSGGAEAPADFAALLYGARGGLSVCVTPYTLSSFSDEALRTGKLLLFSKGGHNNDIIFATRRGLEVNPAKTAALNFDGGERNDARKLFVKAGSPNCFVVPMQGVHDGFVSTGTSLAYFALLTRLFQPGVDLNKYRTAGTYTLCRNDGTPLVGEDFQSVKHYMILHGSWGRPVACSIRSKMVESGLAGALTYDYRNYCHGTFIFNSQRLEDSAIIMLITPREKDIAARFRKFLPKTAKLILLETAADAPEASLDLLIRSSELFVELCAACGVNPASPANPGKVDKRVPMWIPFTSELKKNGPLKL